MIKNQAVNGFDFLLINKTTGAAVTTGAPAGHITLDDGNQTALTGDITHKGGGQWAIDLTADETNGDVIGLLFTHDDAIPVLFTIITNPAPLTAAAIRAEMDANSEQLAAIKAKTDTLGGAGSIEWSYTLTDGDTGEPIADADVWVTSDAAGNFVIASGQTDQNGVVVFSLDAGTVYIWRQKSGYDFMNPDTEVVN